MTTTQTTKMPEVATVADAMIPIVKQAMAAGLKYTDAFTVRLSSWPTRYAADAERQADDVAARLGFPVLVEVRP